MKRNQTRLIRYNKKQNQIVTEKIQTTIIQKGIVISQAKTVREICKTPNYNYSVEIKRYMQS